ncbi:MAG: serine/threonine protein kinase [Planctomycetaceae bacterium]|nr:serine/threonine protein kinase [Planctomycetaceae bacterium]
MSTTPTSKNRDWPEIAGYRIEAVIGRGGMGRVFRARDLKLGRLVAIKCLLHSSDQQLLRRFTEEARAVAQLQHPNIAQLYEFDWNSDPPYFVMEYLAGGTLAELTKARPVEPSLAARIIATLARAIAHAHAKSIIHRDLKPGNVLIASVGAASTRSEFDSTASDSAGASQDLSDANARSLDADFETTRLRIADFGLARHLQNGERLTQTGEVLGTPEYMSPEQATGITSRIGPGTDVYSLGVILYELLTGRPPFAGPDGLQTVMMLLSDEPIPPRAIVPRIPRDLQTICLKCLDKKSNRRYPSADDLAADLDRYGRGEPILARPVSFITRLGKWTARRPWQAAALGLLLFSILGAIVGIVQLQAANQRVQTANEKLLDTNQDLIKANQEAEEAFRISQLGLNGIVTEVRNAIGDIPQASDLTLDVVRQSTQISRELWKLRPHDLLSARQLAQSLEIQRYSEWFIGNEDDYHALTVESYQLLGDLVTQFPEEADLAVMQIKVWMDTADASDVERKLELDRQITKRLDELLQSDPIARVYKVASEQASRDLNEAAARGDLNAVLEAAERHATLSRRYLAKADDTDRVIAQFWLIQSLLSRSRYLLVAQDATHARSSLDEAQQNLAQVPAEQQDSRQFRELQANISDRLSDVARLEDNAEEAVKFLGRAAEQFEKLAQDFPDDSGLKTTLANVYFRQAVVDFHAGRLDASRERLQNAERWVQMVRTTNPADSVAIELEKQIVLLGNAVSDETGRE